MDDTIWHAPKVDLGWYDHNNEAPNAFTQEERFGLSKIRDNLKEVESK